MSAHPTTPPGVPTPICWWWQCACLKAQSRAKKQSVPKPGRTPPPPLFWGQKVLRAYYSTSSWSSFSLPPWSKTCRTFTSNEVLLNHRSGSRLVLLNTEERAGEAGAVVTVTVAANNACFFFCEGRKNTLENGGYRRLNHFGRLGCPGVCAPKKFKKIQKKI